MKSTVRRGIGAGLALFLAIAGIAYLTPARVSVMQAAGRDYGALRLHLQARQQAPETARSGARFGAQVGGVAEAQTRIEAWRRFNSGISPFGFLGWVSDLWPWLLGLGIALPVLGGLIGAQAQARPAAAGWGSRHPAEPPPSLSAALPMASAAPGRAGNAGESRDIPRVDPAANAEADRADPPAPPEGAEAEASRALSADPAAWNWKASPVVRPASPRPKPPPVRSPHGSDAD